MVQGGAVRRALRQGRQQPGTGEVNYVNVLKAIRTAGYAGPLGLEYVPLDQDNAKAVSDAVVLSQAAGLV